MRRAWFSKTRQRVYWRAARCARRVHGRGPLLVAIGDSHTDPSSGYTFPWHVWLRRIGREGYRTVNLGVSGDTTADMRRRIEQALTEGEPEIAVLFGGGNDVVRGLDPAETERNLAFMVDWLQGHGVRNVVLIGPGLLNWEQDASSWDGPLDALRRVLRDVAEQYGLILIDLAAFLRDRIDRGDDPDFVRVPYQQSRSWHAKDGDPHFNAYGQRLVAQAFLEAIPGP